MKDHIRSLFFAFVSIIVSGCGADYRGHGENLAAFSKTRFVPTLEHSISRDTNTIYCSTLLYAWGEVRSLVPAPLQVDKSYKDLYLLNKSTSHENTLRKEEFSSGAHVDGDVVTAWSVLKKSLPFEFPLSSFDDELTFQNQKVASFGTFGFDFPASDCIHILYYKDDDNFLLKLSPKDKDHEIWLCMTGRSSRSLSALVAHIKGLQQTGEKEIREKRKLWRFALNEEDEVVIPKIGFNLETNFASLEGKPFAAGASNYKVTEAWQRVEFSLNEKGAELVSEAMVAVDSTGVDLPKPKKMRFDKPFFVMLKRTDAQYPYFCLWVANTELMQP